VDAAGPRQIDVLFNRRSIGGLKLASLVTWYRLSLSFSFRKRQYEGLVPRSSRYKHAVFEKQLVPDSICDFMLRLG